MNKTLCTLLIAFSLNVWAGCPDEQLNLIDRLSNPMLEGNEIIAVVRGTLGAEVDEDGFLVSTIDVTRSYGLTIPTGKYLISETNFWGQGCVYYQEKPRRPTETEIKTKKSRTVYFAISRFHRRTLVTPENEAHGLFLANKNILYESQNGSQQQIEHVVFERNLLTGVPKKYWLTRVP